MCSYAVPATRAMRTACFVSLTICAIGNQRWSAGAWLDHRSAIASTGWISRPGACLDIPRPRSTRRTRKAVVDTYVGGGERGNLGTRHDWRPSRSRSTHECMQPSMRWLRLLTDAYPAVQPTATCTVPSASGHRRSPRGIRRFDPAHPLRRALPRPYRCCAPAATSAAPSVPMRYRR